MHTDVPERFKLQQRPARLSETLRGDKQNSKLRGDIAAAEVPVGEREGDVVGDGTLEPLPPAREESEGCELHFHLAREARHDAAARSCTCSRLFMKVSSKQLRGDKRR